MKYATMFLKAFSQIYWVRMQLLKILKWYIFNFIILRFIKKIQRQGIVHLFDDYDSFTLNDAIESKAFKHGLIDHFLSPNRFIPNAEDIAVTLNIGVSGHSSECFNTDDVIEIAFLLDEKLKEKAKLDAAFSYIMKLLHKDYNNVEKSTLEDVEKLMNDKVKVFEHYFGIFESDNFRVLLNVYYPGYGKTWVDYLEEESLQVRVSKYDLPRGLFLTEFAYKSKKDGWLRRAVRTKGEVLFNPTFETKGELLWAA